MDWIPYVRTRHNWDYKRNKIQKDIVLKTSVGFILLYLVEKIISKFIQNTIKVQSLIGKDETTLTFWGTKMLMQVKHCGSPIS